MLFFIKDDDQRKRKETKEAKQTKTKGANPLVTLGTAVLLTVGVASVATTNSMQTRPTESGSVIRGNSTSGFPHKHGRGSVDMEKRKKATILYCPYYSTLNTYSFENRDWYLEEQLIQAKAELPGKTKAIAIAKQEKVTAILYKKQSEWESCPEEWSLIEQNKVLAVVTVNP